MAFFLTSLIFILHKKLICPVQLKVEWVFDFDGETYLTLQTKFQAFFVGQESNLDYLVIIPRKAWVLSSGDTANARVFIRHVST